MCLNSGSLASVWALNSSKPCRIVSWLEERERKANNIKGALKKLYGEKEWTSHIEKEKRGVGRKAAHIATALPL